MLTQILINKIIELFIYMLLGLILVKTKLINADVSNPLAKINVYLLITASLINAFQIDGTSSVKQSLIIATIIYLIIELLLIVTSSIYRKAFNLSIIDQASIAYPNVINLVIPLTSALFGDEAIIYVCGPIIIFNIFWWSHGVGLYDSNTSIKRMLKQLFFNPNVIALIIGIIMFSLNVKLTGIPYTAVQTLGRAVGPVAFFTVGVSIGDMKIADLLKYPKVIGSILLKMVILPMIILLLLYIFKVPTLLNNGYEIVMIVLLAASAPTAAMVNQFAIIYDKDKDYANITVILMTLLSLLTLPLVAHFYELIMVNFK